MPPPSVTEIKSRLKGYRFGDLAARDVNALLTNFADLKAADKLQPYVHHTGTTEQLLEVIGTIPVVVKGVTYNIPIGIWLGLDHPHKSPTVFVKPTYDMCIQQTPFVDQNGKVYLPFLAEWKHNSSDLTSLVQIMCATFADKCPVYAKPPPGRAPPQHAHSQPSSYPPPPMGGYPGYGPPPLTGFPPNPGYASGYSGGYGQPPYPASSMPSYPTGAYRPPGMPVPTPPVGNTGPGSYNYGSYQPTASVGPSPFPGTNIYGSVQSSGPRVSEEDERRHFEEQEKVKRDSLVSAVEDKIRRQLTQALETSQDEMESLIKAQDALKEGSRKLNSMLEEMEQKQREADAAIELLRTKNGELESVLDVLKSQPEQLNIDEAVTGTNKLYNQILELYAEENAIDDTIYYLGESLRKGIIPLDVFLKHVRELSRQQFMARATIMKARSVAKLPIH
eukprot:Em0021g375a